MLYIPYIFKSFLFLLLFIPNFAQARLLKNQKDDLTLIELSKTEKNQLIVLWHGMGSHSNSLNRITKMFTQAFPSACVVPLTSLEGKKSIELPIKEQAKISFKELSSKIENIQDKSILLVGHSQGGLSAYTFLKQYQHILSIKGLITLAAPWEGAPGARVDFEMLSAHLTNPVLDDLRKLSISLGYAERALEEQLILNVQSNQKLCLCPGGKDLMEGSTFLNEVKKLLVDEKTPILAIGGGQSDFRALLNKKQAHHFKALNNIYTFFVVGEKHLNRQHDMQVPLYSQHALNILPKTKKNFKRIFIKDAFHTGHVLTITAPAAKNILAHPRVLHEVIKFSKKLLKDK